MTRRTVILLAVLLAVGALAVWRRRPASTAAVRQQDAQAEAAARKFMALREAEERADRELWSSTLPAVRIERELALGVERAMEARSPDAGVLPNLAARISAPAGGALKWMQVRLMRVRPRSQVGAIAPGFLFAFDLDRALFGRGGVVRR
jgi:hypothetical protein